MPSVVQDGFMFSTGNPMSLEMTVALLPVLDDKHFTNPKAAEQAWGVGLKEEYKVSAL